ncbi:type IV secretory system conjugative DNA transfer family protein [Bacillus sp. FDAARGOS_1420]|uniref:type IV secretory system conjugative DNA transfer family protein n=1 Tax=unclassified Bacillus (in: firmicutes) TaxID=185979 RepID=UPI001C5AABCC|nr:type IV secretory system conjugative DNA transfer family protein [Bacillus sp. FDAARGOS_1420]MBW3496625.1 type IV secretory system conjugative DNA transfer family protein [Bacillus sp. FDAARGOS_1420]
MLGIAKKYTKVIRALKELNEGEKVAGVIKARFGAYKTVIEGVKENANDFIFIFDPKGIFYEDTHHEKREQGYHIIKHDLLTGYETLEMNIKQKSVVYISIETEKSTYQERGEALSNFLQYLTECKNIRPIHLVFHQYDLYPIPHMEQFLKESATYHIQHSIVVESQSALQHIYGKEAAQRIITSYNTTILA